MTTILMVEDELAIREVVRRYLEREGFSVLEAESGDGALALLRGQPIDLVVLDIMLPGLDGYTVTRTIRGGTPDRGVPIIILTARGEESDRLAGFQLGVDDYIVKPFSPRELVARVKAVLRRSGKSDDADNKPLVVGRLAIDPRQHSVTCGGKAVSLTATEFDLLWLLARHPRQVFTREQLLDRVWGYGFYGDASTVTVHIRRLREKIEPDASHPTYIHTVWGVGYKFEAAEP
ncbi:MAG: response regulator transcription factor [Chloroflexi bacterium]|nr:response regulator transcription factor [Chloroflexota bacterium]